MFEPVRMQKIRLIGMRSDMPALITALQELGAVQFSKAKDGRLAAEKPLERYQPITEQLIRMRGILESLSPQKAAAPVRELPLDDLLAECSRVYIDKRLSQIRERLESMDAEEEDLREAAKVLESLKGVKVDLSALENRHLCFFTGKISREKFARLTEGLKAITDRHMLASGRMGRHESVVLAADARFNPQITELLQKLGFIETKIPRFQGSNQPAELLEATSRKLESLKGEREALVAELQEISRANYAHVRALCEMLEAAGARAQAPENFGRTEQAFVMDAWLPRSELPRVSEALRRKFGRKLVIEEIESDEEPPTMLKNPGALEPFQFMIEFISLPKSHELDPTIIFALAFPVIYGMMLGDAGYGLASLLIAFVIIRKFKGSMLEPIGKIWAYASIPTMLFGIIYDEYFGFTHEHLLGFSLYSGVARMENITFLLIAFVLIGAAQLGLGFLLGAYNKFREGHAAHGFAKLGWLAIEVSGLVLVPTLMFNALPGILIAPAALVMVVGLAAVVRAEGVVGLIEIPSLAGNMLSYARILAVGIASVVVAELINELLLPKPEQGLLIFVFAPAYLVLHLFNIVLGMFESLVQGARLNYVEFFSKFYEGGGKPFAPFMRIRRFTTQT